MKRNTIIMHNGKHLVKRSYWAPPSSGSGLVHNSFECTLNRFHTRKLHIQKINTGFKMVIMIFALVNTYIHTRSTPTWTWRVEKYIFRLNVNICLFIYNSQFAYVLPGYRTFYCLLQPRNFLLLPVFCIFCSILIHSWYF